MLQSAYGRWCGRSDDGLQVATPGVASYTGNVIRFDSRPFVFLHTSLLVLLVLGVIVRPVLTHIGALHAAEHAALADADNHGHAHDDDHDDEPGADHTDGAHGLMHQAGSGGAFSETVAMIVLPAVHGRAPMLSTADVSRVPAHRFVTPLRPPIA